MGRVLEFFGTSTSDHDANWNEIVTVQRCPYMGRKCIKTRKSDPDVAIGTCSVIYSDQPAIICPIRLRERHQIFFDCMHLLSLNEPGNEIHAVAEVSIPGGSLDYVLVSAREGRVKDFVGIEIQTLDTTGTVWPERQRFLHSVGIRVPRKDRESKSSFGMNWKMTAKTILVQLHHKIQTFEFLNKKLVLAIQDRLLFYMEKEFSFGHLNNPALIGDSMHFHAYELANQEEKYSINLRSRKSTNTEGIATALGLRTEARVELSAIVSVLEGKINPSTRLVICSH